MKIEKINYGGSGYILCLDDMHVLFKSFTKDSKSVTLWKGSEMVGILYFDKATEFYKAWRECHNGL